MRDLGILAAPHAAEAQPPARILKIGYIEGGSPSTRPQLLAALFGQLKP